MTPRAFRQRLKAMGFLPFPSVIVTGGIVALGKTPIPSEIPGGGPLPAWLRVIPDLRLLDGSAIPPVVPNVIDIRIMNCPISTD